MTSKNVDDWRQSIAPIWDRCLAHPFITELANGTLPLDKFQFYLLQDHQYLDEFDDLHRLLSKQMETPQLAKEVLALASPEGSVEQEAQDPLLEAAGLNNDDVVATPLAPTAQAYINHMIVTAHLQGAAAGVAGLVPCDWMYAWIFNRVGQNAHPANPAYQSMIDFYVGDTFQNAAAGMVDAMRQLAQIVDDATRQKMQRAFNVSSDYELMYWDMAYNRELWPHQRFTALKHQGGSNRG